MGGNMIADEVLVSTGIYDSVSKEPYAGYVVIKGDSILEVGRGEIPDKYKEPSIPVHDYGDATICAGFGDTHTFFTGFIIDNLGVDLSGTKNLEAQRSKPPYMVCRLARNKILDSCLLCQDMRFLRHR